MPQAAPHVVLQRPGTGANRALVVDETGPRVQGAPPEKPKAKTKLARKAPEGTETT